MIVAATAVAGGTIPRQNPASIRKSGPEIKNHCAPRVKSQENPAAILKLAPSNQESLHAGGRFQAKPCSDSQIDPLKSRTTAATTTAGGPFFSAAKKIRIGRGDSLQKVSHPQQIPSTRSITRCRRVLPWMFAWGGLEQV